MYTYIHNLIELLLELSHALRLLLCTTNIHGLALELETILLLDSIACCVHAFKVDECETLRLACLVLHQSQRGNITEGAELRAEIFFSDFLCNENESTRCVYSGGCSPYYMSCALRTIQVLDEDVRVLLLGGAILELTLSLALEFADVNDLFLQHLAIDLHG